MCLLWECVELQLFLHLLVVLDIHLANHVILYHTLCLMASSVYGPRSLLSFTCMLHYRFSLHPSESINMLVIDTDVIWNLKACSLEGVCFYQVRAFT